MLDGQINFRVKRVPPVSGSLLDMNRLVHRKKSHLQIRVPIENNYFHFSNKTYVVDTQKNRLNETVLLSIQKKCYN